MTQAEADSEDVLPPGSLWEAAAAVEARGRASGALVPMLARVEAVPEAGIPFAVRVLEGMEHKRLRERDQRRTRTNPFLPPEPELTVGHLSPTHCAVVNKFPVIARHLVVITRRYARQEAALDRDDFAAALRCLAEGPALAFYNGGRAAGSTQGHKHLQVVPLPVGAGDEALPMEAAYRTGRPELPFQFGAAGFTAGDPEAAHARYQELLRATDLATMGDPRPYNLLLRPDWLAVVPRARGSWQRIPSNALCYAGALFARGDAQLERIRELGPLRVLRETARVG